jgi:hypothetical protein
MEAAWESVFVDEVRSFHGDVAAQACEDVIDGIHERGLKLVLEAPQGTKGMGFMVVVPRIEWEPTPVASHGKPGTIGWELPNIARGNPFKSAPKIDELRGRLGAIPGMDLSYPSYPKTPYQVLGEQAAVPVLLDVLDWTVARLRGSNPV